MWLLMDVVRRMQGNALEGFGCGPAECDYRIVGAGLRWRLRAYAGGDTGPPVLIVAAPIKRPYIWDLAPWASAVRRCLREGLRVYLLEWQSPPRGDGGAGLDDYAGRSVGEAVARLLTETGGVKPFVMGHSLGGTLAAIFAALAPESVRGLVLLGTPLCFEKGSSRLRDGIISMVPPPFPEGNVVPGSLLSQLCAVACPETFVWARLADAGLSMSDPHALAVHALVERWALDELPLPGRLVGEILQWLFREDRFHRGTLSLNDRTVGPGSLHVPMLLVVNTADEVAPPTSVKPFVAAMPGRDICLFEHGAEIGVGLQHLAILVGRTAHARIWPRIISWLRAHV